MAWKLSGIQEKGGKMRAQISRGAVMQHADQCQKNQQNEMWFDFIAMTKNIIETLKSSILHLSHSLKPLIFYSLQGEILH